MRLLQAGKPGEAQAIARKLLKVSPRNPDALRLSGFALLMDGRPADAEKVLSRLVKAGQRDDALLINLALAQVRGGRTTSAERTVEALRKQVPGHVDAALLLAEIYVKTDRTAEVPWVLAPLAVQVPDPRLWLALGDAYRILGSFDPAERAYRDVLQGAPSSVQALHGLARLPPPHVLADERLDLLRRAIDLGPTDAALLADYAMALEQANRLTEAEEMATHALALVPDEAGARLTMARVLVRRKALDEALAALDAIGDQGSADILASAEALRARILDKQRQAHAAAQAMVRAHAIAGRTERARTIDQHSFPRLLSSLHAWTDGGAAIGPAATASEAAEPSDGTVIERAPIFFVGFPRSGTTLMEQMLGSHPDLRTTDEAPFLHRVVSDLPSLLERPFTYPDDLATLTTGERRRVAAAYSRRVADAMGPSDGRRLVDKLPLNGVFLPLVAAVFPKAKVLIAERDPRDVVLSCFMQMFALNEAMIQLREPDKAAHVYQDYLCLLHKLSGALPIGFVSYHYEDLVADPEPVLRRVLERLEVSWDPGVLDHTAAARARAITTPSYSAVQERAHCRAVGRWKAYAEVPPLAEAFAFLGTVAEKQGYTAG